MRNPFTGLIAALTEAWAEIRIHRTRVIVSLLGVTIAVAALTSVVAFTGIAQQINQEQLERSGGRPATLSIQAYPMGEQPLEMEAMVAAFETAVDRYEVGHSSRNLYTSLRAQFADGVVDISTTVVDPAYSAIHRLTVVEGRWYTDRDALALAPQLVVNENVWRKLGSPDLSAGPVSITLRGQTEYTAVVVGVTSLYSWQTNGELEAYMLYPDYLEVASAEERRYMAPGLEIWVPLENADALMERFRVEIQAALGTEAQVDVFRNDYLAYSGQTGFEVVQWIGTGISGLVLLLGALGLVNVALVTVRQRIKEIGIRRSVGATAGRVFFVVMMENVVATAAAGVVGVMLAVALVRNPLVLGWIAAGITDLPPFPMDAAILGLACATAVGALAGLLPALVAVRVRVIDAIRY